MPSFRVPIQNGVATSRQFTLFLPQPLPYPSLPDLSFHAVANHRIPCWHHHGRAPVVLRLPAGTGLAPNPEEEFLRF